MKKRLFSLILVICMIVSIFALASCNRERPETPPDDTLPGDTTTADNTGNEPVAPAVTIKEMSKVVYDAAKSYYDKHNVAEVFEDLTLTYTGSSQSIEKEKLEYKDDPANAEEAVKEAEFTNIFKTKTTHIITVKTVDGVPYAEVNVREEHEDDFHRLKAPYTLEHVEESYESVNTYQLAKIGDSYYYLEVYKELIPDEPEVITNKYFKFADQNAYLDAVKVFLRRVNAKTVYPTFFGTMEIGGELQLIFDIPTGGLTFEKKENTFTINADVEFYDINSKETGLMEKVKNTASVLYVGGQASSAKAKTQFAEEGFGAYYSWQQDGQMTIAYSSDLSIAFSEPTLSWTELSSWQISSIPFPAMGIFDGMP